MLINTHPDKDALIAFFRDGDLEGNEDDFWAFKDTYMGVWSSNAKSPVSLAFLLDAQAGDRTGDHQLLNL